MSIFKLHVLETGLVIFGETPPNWTIPVYYRLMEFSAFVLIPTPLCITRQHRQKSQYHVWDMSKPSLKMRRWRIHHGVFGIATDTNHDIFSLNTFRRLTPMLTFRALRGDFELQSKILQCFRYTIEVVKNDTAIVKTQNRLKSESGHKVWCDPSTVKLIQTQFPKKRSLFAALT